MTLQEFKRTRVTMTVEQYASLYDGDFDTINKETAKMHVYKNGLYLRELLNGFYCSDLGDETRIKELDAAENCFWNSYANDFYNPKPKLSKEVIEALYAFKLASQELSRLWYMIDDEQCSILETGYPKYIGSFDGFSIDVKEWVNVVLTKNDE